MGYRAITHLTEPRWERQPDETPAAYARFVTYRDLPRGTRTIAAVATDVGVRRQSVHEQAKAHRWDDRAAAFDAELSRRHHERLAWQAERLAEQQLAAAHEMIHAVRAAIREMTATGQFLDPQQTVRWAEVAIKLGDAALDTAERTRIACHTTRTEETSTTTWSLDLPEFAGLTPTPQRKQFDELVSSIESYAHHHPVSPAR